MWRLAPTLLSVVGAVVYLVLGPRSPDLAAHVFRSELFGREGFTIWNGQWYSGHHTPAYSVLSPPLGWLLGPQLLGAASSVAATACFEAITRRHYGTRSAAWGAVWFGVASVTLLFTARLAFALGVAFGLAALFALQRRRPRSAVALAVLSALASPVAGLFVSLCGAALALGSTRRRRTGAALAAAGLVPSVILSAAFPEGGYVPFPLGIFLPILLFSLLAAGLMARREPVLAWGAALYGAGTTLTFVVPTAMGGNTERLGELAAGPLLACALTVRRRFAVPLALLFVALAAWQWYPAVRDVRKGLTDPSARRGYYEPLTRWLREAPGVHRVEALFSFGKWESAEVARELPLARGWSRQLDTRHHGIFYGRERMGPRSYRRWLDRNGVTHVAVPRARLDRTAKEERRLIGAGLPYLRRRWSNRDWRVYEVRGPRPIVVPRGSAAIGLESMSSDRLVLRVTRPGTAMVRVRWTPYWLAHEACVRPAGEWTKVRASRRGVLLLSTRFGAERLVARGRPCDELPEARADAEELEQRLERLSGGAWPLRHSAASSRRSGLMPIGG